MLETGGSGPEAWLPDTERRCVNTRPHPGAGSPRGELCQAIIKTCGSPGLTRTGTVAPGWKLPIAIRLTTCVRVAE